MTIHLAMIVSAFVIAFTSYQPVQAGANNFTAKPIRIGDNLISIMRQHGFSERQRQEVLSKDAGLRHLFLTLDTKYLLRKEKSEVELIMFDSQTNASFRIIKQDKKILAARYYPQFKITNARVDGRVYGSLLGSILPKLNSNWVASRFMDAYAFEMKTGRSLEKGAKFWFMVEKKYLGGHFIKYGEVTQTFLEIRGQPIQKRFVRVMNGGVFFRNCFEQIQISFHGLIINL